MTEVEHEKREKVIKELECCIRLNSGGSECTNCDYADESYHGDCETYLLRDALALLKAQEQKCRECGEATSKAIQELQAKLKAQEPRVMTLEEVKSHLQNREIAFLVEHNDLSDPVWMLYYGYLSALKEIVFIDGIDHMHNYVHNYGIDGYGIDWRCCTSRPDQATREATPWN